MMENSESLSDLIRSGRNWTEDYIHENGKYTNVCAKCKSVFLGHKRRVVCRKCA